MKAMDLITEKFGFDYDTLKKTLLVTIRPQVQKIAYYRHLRYVIDLVHTSTPAVKFYESLITKNERDELNKITPDIQNGKIKNLKIKISFDQGPYMESGSLTFKNSTGIYFKLLDIFIKHKSGPSPQKGRAGQKEKKYICELVEICISYLDGRPYIKTDKRYFAGLILAHYDLIITPDQYIKDNNFTPQDGINEYRKYIADQVKYYI